MPDLEEGSLKEGLLIRRGSSLTTPLGKGERTACEFRTAHDVTLWPLTVTEAKYLSGAGALAHAGTAASIRVPKAAIRLRLKAAAGHVPRITAARRARFLRQGDARHRLAHSRADPRGLRRFVCARGRGLGSCLHSAGEHRWSKSGSTILQRCCRLPRAGYAGYRLLQEYFMLPERFMFFGLRGLRPALRDV